MFEDLNHSLFQRIYWSLTHKIRGETYKWPWWPRRKRYDRLVKAKRFLYEKMTKLGIEIPGPPHRV